MSERKTQFMRSNDIYKAFGISDEVLSLVRETEKELLPRFLKADDTAALNQLRVVRAMQEENVADYDMYGSTGYGHNDSGRDRLEAVYARVFGTEDALVRSQIICGTHALTVALSGNLRPGDTLYMPAGLPYDTLQPVIGIRPMRGSLAEYGVRHVHSELLPDEGFDWDDIEKKLGDRSIRLCAVQRSRGYSLRHSFSVKEIGELIRFIKERRPDVLVMVDNCYGEFVCDEEPSSYGADMVVGSLIKNPGGGIAPVGGYIAGTAECVENAAARLSAPGLFKEQGPSLGNNRLLFQGLFLAPSVSAAALKGAMLAGSVYEKLGFKVTPGGSEERSDIIQAVVLGDRGRVISFCKGVQRAACVDHMAAPEPAPMPGYESDIIMAAGCFIQGSSIELSADGPLREPYAVFFQGGLTYQHARLGTLLSLQQLLDDGLLKL